MGLTIHYNLHKTTKTTEDMVKYLEGIRQKCLDLPVLAVSDMTIRKGEACDHYKMDREDPFRWLVIQATEWIDITKAANSMRPPCSRVEGDSEIRRDVSPTEIVGFEVEIGDGCESLCIFFARYPKTIEIKAERGHEWAARVYGLPSERTVRTGLGSGWHCLAFCKTQYASQYGLDNFLKCHKTVLSILKLLRPKPAQVHDEGKYWETGDEALLIKELGDYDVLVASVGGALKDAFGEQVVTAMDDNPATERLEAKGAADPAITAYVENVKAAIPGATP